jgi:SAM-dependent methyltransferase
MTHYDEKYFAYQKAGSIIGGHLNKFKFEKYIKDTDVLMDFGCGGGYLLNNFNNKEKIGFEINKVAWEECKKHGIVVYDNFDNIEDNSIDTIISNHAMEHVPLPLQSFKQLYKKLKVGGTAIIVIPCEQPSELGFYYRPNDINQHLHTWCPMTFGNLATLAGFKVIECKPFQHQWCPDFQQNWKNPNFHQRCREYAIKNKNYQIKLVATKIN